MNVLISPLLYRILRDHVSTVKMNVSSYSKYCLNELKFALDGISDSDGYSNKIAYVNEIKSLFEEYMKPEERTASFNFVYSVKECVTLSYYHHVFDEESSAIILLAIARDLRKLGKLPDRSALAETDFGLDVSRTFTSDLYHKFCYNVHMKPNNRMIKVEINHALYNAVYEIVMNEFMYENNNPTSCKINTRVNYYVRGSLKKMGTHMRICKRKFGISYETFLAALERYVGLVTNMDFSSKKCTINANIQRELSLDDSYRDLFPSNDFAVNMSLAYCLIECNLLKAAQKVGS
jgi:hypothetical protein